MSYATLHNYGYGICVDDIKTQNVARLEAMLKLAPKLDRAIHEWLKGNTVNKPNWNDYMEFDQDFRLGLATILQKTIEEAEGLCLTVCDDYDSRAYLLYQPSYPWQLTIAERELTEEHVVSVFQRYVGMLTDEAVDVDYQEGKMAADNHLSRQI